jgi:hypothetical protein
MKVSNGKGWSYHTINEHNNYSRWRGKKNQYANQKPLDLKYYVENAIKSTYSCKRNWT